MSSYYVPDLTASNPNYLVTNDNYVITASGQRIVFPQGPVYLSTIVATLIGTVNTLMEQGQDWSYIPATDVDITTTAKLLTQDPSFSAILVTAIEFIRPVNAPITVSLQYQKLFPVVYKSAVYDNQRVNLTPDLIIDLINRLQNIEMLVTQPQSTIAISTNVPKLLPIDLTGAATSNLIENEIYTINVLDGQNIIIPTNGSFYKGTVVLKDSNNNALNVNTDYQFFDMNVAKTRACTSTSGVYDMILVTKPYVGNVSLTAQYFGGDVTRADVETIYGLVQNISTFLSETPFVTVPGLSSLTAIQSILNRMTTLEASMRQLLNAGNPTYSDVTGNGSSVVSKIRSNDNVNHWWTIATLYKVNGSSSITIADRMHFRMQLANANIMADVFVTVNLNTPNDLFSVDSIAVNQDVGFAPNGTVRTIPIVMPMFRVIWNEGGTSGIVLQIGLALPSLTETIALEDLSGSQSCWLLAAALTSPTLPMDNTITLPDGVSIWDTTNSNSASAVHMMPNETGYLAWSGSENLISISSETPFQTILPNTFNIPDVNSVTLVFSTSSGNPLSVIVPVLPSTVSAGSMAGSGYVPSSQPDGTPTLVDVTLGLVDNVVNVVLNPELFYGLTGNLSLIQIIVNF